VGRASGGGGSGAWALALGLEPGAHDGGARVRVNRQRTGLLAPWPSPCRGGAPGRLPEGLRHGGHPPWGPRGGRASRDSDRQQSLQAPRCIEGEPVADGGAMPPQELGHLPAALRLPTGQEGAHLAPWCLTTIMFTLSALLKRVCRFGHERSRCVPRLLS
jgi:hypothetical protein